MKTKTKNTTAQTFVIALAVMLALSIGSTIVFGQNKTIRKASNSAKEDLGNSLVGVWESVGPATTNCETGAFDPDSPIIRVLYKFNQGGTMTEENTDPIEGPYRTTGHGIWRRVFGRNYEAVYVHYGFLPDKTHAYTIRVKTNITLESDSNSMWERGTFEVFDAQNNDEVVFSGCFNSTYKRLQF